MCYIESIKYNDQNYCNENGIKISGWAFDPENKIPLSLESVNADGVDIRKSSIICDVIREDVASHYRLDGIVNCGFTVELNSMLPGRHTLKFIFNINRHESYVYAYNYKVKSDLPNILISAIKKKPTNIFKVKYLKKALLFLFKKHTYFQSDNRTRQRMLDEYLGYFNGQNAKICNIDRSIDIIIPVYNGIDYLKSLVESILKNTKSPYRIIFVDDCSSDSEVVRYLTKIVAENSNFMLLKNEENVGFVKCVNKAYSVCENDLIILNTDTEVPPYWMERLIKPLECASIASVTPFSNAATICSFPLIMKDNRLYESLPVDVIDKYFQKIDNIVFDVPTGVGFCMAIKKKVADKIGLFDEIFDRGYGEENDFCLRARKAGYRNVMAPNVFVYHKHGGSFTSQEKQRLMNANLAIVNNRYPNYLSEVSRFIDDDILQGIRILIECLIQSNEIHKNIILIFDHDLGGGASQYCEGLIGSHLASNDIIILIKYKYKLGKYSLSIKGLEESPAEFLFDKIEGIEKIVEFFSVNKVYLNELVSYPNCIATLEILRRLKNKIQFEIILLVHDYYCICPSVNLLNLNNKYCYLPELSQCIDCWEKGRGKLSFYSNIDIKQWRTAWGEAIGDIDKIVCFSESSKKILYSVYPNDIERKVFVIPHTIQEFNHKVRFREDTNSTINVAVIGNEAVHKGSHIVFEMAEIAFDRNIDIHFYLMGKYDKKVVNPLLTILGAYHREDLPEMMEKYLIDLILIPSIWPETFSFTTEEAIMMDMPVAVFNIGAPPERVRKYSKGLILEEINAEDALSRIVRWIKIK